VIVVGRGEDTAALDVVRVARRTAATAVRWIAVGRPGHIPPVRRGLDAAQGRIVAFLDDDAEPEKSWLSALLEPFRDTGVACVGGRVITPGFKGRVGADAGRIRWYGQHAGNIGALDVPAPIEVDGVMEGNWAWRSDALRRLSFDSVFDSDDSSMYGLDLCLQAKALGYRIVYQPAARVVHHAAPRDASLDRQDRPRRVFAYSRNYTYLAMKHLRGVRRAVFLGWWWLIGERGSYGLAAGLSDLLTRGHAEVSALVRASLAGKWAGLRAWRAR